MSSVAGRRWVVIFALALAGGAAAPQAHQDALVQRYQALRSQLDAAVLGLPLIVTSIEDGDRMLGEVDALLEQPFDLLVRALVAPAQWCRLLMLHVNVKGCTHASVRGRDVLTVYSGRKGFETPAQSHALRFDVRILSRRDDHLHIELSAPSGPMGTSDYRFTLAAVPVAKGSFLRLSYGYKTSAMSRIATAAYLSTAGHEKIGFTVVGRDPAGRPVHVDGRRGIVERNAVRYYLAIQTHLETATMTDSEWQDRAPGRWFELTERWPAQLRELDLGEYLQNKRREIAGQLLMQQVIDASGGGRR